MRGTNDQLIVLHRYFNVLGKMQLLQQGMGDANALGVANADNLRLDTAS
jgi:hypothetical protein